MARSLSSIALLAAVLCAGSAQSALSQTVASWSFENDDSTWQPNQQCKTTITGGRLIVRSTGNDPYLVSDAEGPQGWLELTIRAQANMNCDAQLFWSTTAQEGFAESKSVHFELRRSRAVREQKVYFQADGPLKQLRLDPHNGSGTLAIESMSLRVNGPPPAPQPKATPVDAITVQDGFQVELLYSVPGDTQGSWVSMTHDDRGRLIVCDQQGSLYRVTLPNVGDATDNVQVEKIQVDLGMAQGLLYAFDSLYVMVNDYRGSKSGFYRVLDTDNDDTFDTVKTLKRINGRGEHGPHAILLSPDKKSLYICAGNHTELIDVDRSQAPRHWDEDQLLTRMWDAGGHAVGKLAPGGWIVKTDPEGKEYELVGMGFRNEYDMAFNVQGDLFTFDADMEWDVGSPWYRPTRINHVTAGAEFGWRSGTGKWPAYYPDSIGSVVDIGPGSPTGIVFGTGAKFPAKHQQALFIADWSYGKIYTVHMKPAGSTYQGVVEQFMAASPLPVTDMVVNPADGALYFAIGGRGTQSGLYRVTYVGSESTEPATPASLTPAQQQRKVWEQRIAALVNDDDAAKQYVDEAFQTTPHDDHVLRYTRRIYLEHLPLEKWQAQALAQAEPDAVIHASVALARKGSVEADAEGKAALQGRIIDNLTALSWEQLDRLQQLQTLRAYGLAFIRLGEPSDSVRKKTIAAIDNRFPANDAALNRELCKLLTYLEAPKVADRTLALLAKDPPQEEQIAYVLALRELESGWTMDTRRQYFRWFTEASLLSGGNSFSRFLTNIRSDAMETLSDKEREALKPLLAAKAVGEATKLPERPFVKKWTVAELLPLVEQELSTASGVAQRDLRRGERLFTQGACFKCHRFAGRGGIVGPDLTGVAGRFNAKNLLESLIEPNKVISDQYQSTAFRMDDGKVVVGRIANAKGDRLMVMTDMLNPGRFTVIRRGEIEQMRPSAVSMMPAGILDTYTKEEILDLLAYLKNRGSAIASR